MHQEALKSWTEMHGRWWRHRTPTDLWWFGELSKGNERLPIRGRLHRPQTLPPHTFAPSNHLYIVALDSQDECGLVVVQLQCLFPLPVGLLWSQALHQGSL